MEEDADATHARCRAPFSRMSSGRPPRYPALWGVPVLAVLALTLPLTLGNTPLWPPLPLVRRSHAPMATPFLARCTRR